MRVVLDYEGDIKRAVTTWLAVVLTAAWRKIDFVWKTDIHLWKYEVSMRVVMDQLCWVWQKHGKLWESRTYWSIVLEECWGTWLALDGKTTVDSKEVAKTWGLTEIQVKTRQRKLQWFGHVRREEGLVEDMNVPGVRPVAKTKKNMETEYADGSVRN